jgi:hypothetical protein
MMIGKSFPLCPLEPPMGRIPDDTVIQTVILVQGGSYREALRFPDKVPTLSINERKI